MTGEHRPNATPIVMHNYECAECGASIRITDDLVTVNVFGHAKAAHRTCPISPDTACHVCHEPTMRRQGRWVHTHGDESCGAGDGSTAYPELLWLDHEATRHIPSSRGDEPEQG